MAAKCAQLQDKAKHLQDLCRFSAPEANNSQESVGTFEVATNLPFDVICQSMYTANSTISTEKLALLKGLL